MRGGERGGSQTAHRLSMQEEGPRYDLRGARRGRDQAQGGSGHHLYEIDARPIFLPREDMLKVKFLLIIP